MLDKTTPLNVAAAARHSPSPSPPPPSPPPQAPAAPSPPPPALFVDVVAAPDVPAPPAPSQQHQSSMHRSPPNQPSTSRSSAAAASSSSAAAQPPARPPPVARPPPQAPQPAPPSPSRRADTPQPLAADERAVLRAVYWGNPDSDASFVRWAAQGFVFSAHEPSALVQHEGGPCAVLAPVQAHLLQRLLARGDDGQLHQAAAESSGYWDQERLAALPPARCEQLLVEALGAILDKCRKQPFTKRESDEQATGQQASGEKASGEQTGQRLFRIVQLRKRPAGDDASTAPQSSAASTSSVPTIDVTTGGAPGGDDDDDPAGGGRPCADDFHARLDCVEFGTLAEVHAYYLARIPRLRQRYGVLLFVYSVLLTKGLNDVKAELHDEGETLVQEPHGHGGQGLINLMLTGRAVQHVFDDVMHMYEDETNTKIICTLQGIDKQSDIGYLALVEQLRICTVGSFLKNPHWPVWIVASDVHLTVLFSSERRLVLPDSAATVGRRVFKSFETDGNGFIKRGKLQAVLRQLNLVSEPEYVDIMVRRLDPDHLDVIMVNDFMEEFFGGHLHQMPPDTFDVLHYNGVPHSNGGGHVRYHLGHAVMLETDLRAAADATENGVLAALQTKWPAIDVQWRRRDELDRLMPTLN